MPVKGDRTQISLVLTKEQIALLDAEQESRNLKTRSDVIRGILGAYFGDRWSDADLSWGGFAPEARSARWEKDKGADD